MPLPLTFGQAPSAGATATKAAARYPQGQALLPPLRPADDLNVGIDNSPPTTAAAPQNRVTVIRVKPTKVRNGTASVLNTAQPAIGARAYASARSATSSRVRGRPTSVLSTSAVAAQSSTF